MAEGRHRAPYVYGYAGDRAGRRRRPGTPEARRVTIPDAARQVNEALGKAVVQAANEVTVYLFGGDTGRAAVEAVWQRREQAARARR